MLHGVASPNLGMGMRLNHRRYASQRVTVSAITPCVRNGATANRRSLGDIARLITGRIMTDETLRTPDYAISDTQQLKEELRWCLSNGMHGPRTEATLRWAIEVLEEIEEVKT